MTEHPDLNPITYSYWQGLTHLADHGTNEELHQFATETARDLTPEQTAAIITATICAMRDLLRTLTAHHN